MPWVVVDEPFATPPKAVGPLAEPRGDGAIDVDERWGSIVEADLQGGVDVSLCEQLELRGSVLRGVTFRAQPGIELEVNATRFVECDLTALRFTKLTNTSFEGCKISGVDFSAGLIRDVVFERCLLRLSVFRMAELERVEFRDCTLDDLDCYEASLSNVSVPGTDLRAVEFDKTRFQAVDLRGAQDLDIRSGRRFEGCLLDQQQLLPLVHLFADAAGVSVAREDEE